MTILGSGMKSAETVFSVGDDWAAGGQQGAHTGEMAMQRSGAQRIIFIRAATVHIGPTVKQQFQSFQLPLEGSPKECGMVIRIRMVAISTGLQKYLHTGHLPVLGSDQQRRAADGCTLSIG